MATLAAFISSAIEKVSHDEVYANMEFATPEDARTNFTAALLFELGLGPKPEVEKKPAAPEPVKEKKKRAPKKAQEVAVAEVAVPILEEIRGAEAEALAEQMGQLALDGQSKPKKAKKEPVAAANAAPEPVKEKKKPGPKPKPKAEGAGNLEKLTPTHKKHLKAIAEELKVEPREKEFLTYANEMSAEEWSAKPLNDHIRVFLAPEGEAELAEPPTPFLEVEFNGKEYLVDPKTKFVYTASSSPTVKARSHVGVVGLQEFKDMEIPEEDA